MATKDKRKARMYRVRGWLKRRGYPMARADRCIVLDDGAEWPTGQERRWINELIADFDHGVGRRMFETPATPT